MNKKELTSRILTNIIFILYTVFAVAILGIILLSDTDYACKKEFYFGNIVLAVVGIVLVLVLYLVFAKACKNQAAVATPIGIASICLFAVQVFIFYNIYFISQHWDAWIVIKNAHFISNGAIDQLNNLYFSRCTNNQFIVILYSYVFRLMNLIGITDIELGLTYILALQCLLTTLTGRILFSVIYRATKLISVAWTGWIVYVVLIALSGWNVVTYTDIMSILFPTLILWIYQSVSNEKYNDKITDKYKYIKWFLIITCSYWGFKIRPTVLIVAIAIIIVELINIISQKMDTEKIKTFAIVCSMALICVIAYNKAFDVMLDSTGLQINEEADMGALHLMMMGLNEENNGVWYEPDVKMTNGIASKSERTAAQLEVIKQRLSDYGFIGYMRHLWKKTLVIYNDGSFAWGCEGGFFDFITDDRNEFISPVLKNLYYTFGENYIILSSIEQIFWLATLIMSAGVLFLKKNNVNMVLILSLVGIIIFNYLFEARARYVIIYVPFWVMAAAMVVERGVSCRRIK